MKVADGTVVSFHYKLTDMEGETLDSSEGEEPLTYLHGHENIISGLEGALEGREAGDKFQVEVGPEGGYGERDDDLVETVDRSNFEVPGRLEPGMQFRAQFAGGERIVTVQDIEGDDVTVDGNHPLAGQTLLFEVEVTEVREATAEEISHGHVHAHGDHGH